MSICLRRREFITALGGAAASWPLAAGAQQRGRVRRIGVLMPLDENDPAAKPRLSAFTQALGGLGWTDGRNVQIDVRWAGIDINRIRAVAQELVGLKPDIIMTTGTAATVAVQRETRTIPIIFLTGIDPVATGIVPRLNQPGGNVTGFAASEPALAGKWLELLSEIAPGLKRAAIMFNPDIAAASAYMSSFEAAALTAESRHAAACRCRFMSKDTARWSSARTPNGDPRAGLMQPIPDCEQPDERGQNHAASGERQQQISHAFHLGACPPTCPPPLLVAKWRLCTRLALPFRITSVLWSGTASVHPSVLTLHPTQRTIAEVLCFYGGFCDVVYSVLRNLAKI